MADIEIPRASEFFSSRVRLAPKASDEIQRGLDVVAPFLESVACAAQRWRGAHFDADADADADADRELCLDLAAELLEGADVLHAQGEVLAAFALEGIGGRLLEALVNPSAP